MMMDESMLSELKALTSSGDLLDLARQMRNVGVESLLFCGADGRIARVVTDRQIAHLASVDARDPARAGVPEPAGDPHRDELPQQAARRALPANQS